MEALELRADVSIDELVALAAVDNELFCSTFFPRTFRQVGPKKHKEIWDALDDPRKRRVLLQCFRGSAKTTLMRAFMLKRVAYYISRTIFFVAASDQDATRTIMWLRSQIERNKLFAQTFQLSPGRKWNENEMEIIHGVEQQPIWILGAGYTGSVRGVNFEDYRPDLILLDDVVTDETAATKDQREKQTDLILGAIDKSLAPVSEEPNAKIVMAQTPLHPDDPSERAKKSHSWHVVSFPCWTPETIDLPLEQQESAWPERWSDKELREDKLNYLAQNKLSVWNREMEVRLSSPETAAFKPEWLKVRKQEPVPGSMFAVLAIDPAPPPSAAQVEKGLHKKDFEALAVVGRQGPDYHILEYRQNRGHEPNWTQAAALELAMKWRVARIVFEPIAYQRTLGYLLRQAMQRARVFFSVIDAPTHGMKKYHRIVSTISGLASHGHLWCGPGMVELVDQFNSYDRVDHDDLLDAVALGLANIVNPYIELGTDEYSVLDEKNVPDLVLHGRAP